VTPWSGRARPPASANRTDVIVFGLDESQRFSVVGVGDPQPLQEEITHLATHDMAPKLRPVFTVDEIEGNAVVAIEVGELPTAQERCC
jgi:predicted HTH transcriptional regulator